MRCFDALTDSVIRILTLLTSIRIDKKCSSRSEVYEVSREAYNFVYSDMFCRRVYLF